MRFARSVVRAGGVVRVYFYTVSTFFYGFVRVSKNSCLGVRCTVLLKSLFVEPLLQVGPAAAKQREVEVEVRQPG